MTPDKKGRAVGREEFEQFFVDFRFTAFRLETLQEYSVDDEKDSFQRFLSDDRSRFSTYVHEWGGELRSGISAGRRYSRVHVVTEPLSDYVRFECACGYRLSVTAGEEIRILPVREGDWPEGIPHLDYWLFDSHQLLRMDYTADGTLLPPVLVDDPEQIVAANHWRDRAMQTSIPYTEYETRFDAAMRPR